MKPILFRAKLEFEWNFEDIEGERRLKCPSQLPVEFGPFCLKRSPNAEFYLEELGWINSSPLKVSHPDHDYPVSLLYVETRIQVRKGYHPEGVADETFEQLEAMLRLFQEGDVSLHRHFTTFQLEEEKPKWVIFLRPQPIKPEPAPLYHRGPYKLDDETLQRFIGFFDCYWDIIDQKQQPICNALYRFSSSYERRTLGDRLMDLVIALEALFGDKNGGDSLTYKIGLRCSSFLYPPGEARNRAFKAVKKVYGDRSAIVHGERIDSRYTGEEVDQLEEQVRGSIAKFMEQHKKGYRITSGQELDELLFFKKE